VHHVGGGYEEDLREVVLDVEVVIDEHEILFGIEHFEQRRRGIAAEVHRHFVDFVEHEDRVLGAGFLHHLDDLAGHGSDVGAAMAAISASSRTPPSDMRTNLRPVALAIDIPSEVCLRGRPDEAENRALGIFHQLADGEKFEDALLDFLQAIVIFVRVFSARVMLRISFERFFQGTARSQSR